MSGGRILHLSDIHFGCENRPALKAVAEIAAREAFDLTVITGDITQFGRRREFAAAAAWIGALPGLRLITPGNHDVPYATPGRALWPFRRYEETIGPSWGDGLTGPGFRARAFNTARGVQARWNWSKGVAPAEEVAEAADYLAGEHPHCFKIAACHHPLIEVTGGPMTGEVKRGHAATRQLAEAGADLLLSGHVHTAFAHPLPYGEGFVAVGASTLSLRERGQPAGFNIIEWDAGCIRVRAEGWTGSHFETIRTWAFDRKSPSAQVSLR